jgi:hypothetical protein
MDTETQPARRPAGWTELDPRAVDTARLLAADAAAIQQGRVTDPGFPGSAVRHKGGARRDAGSQE